MIFQETLHPYYGRITEPIFIWLSYMSGVGSGEIIVGTEYIAHHGTSLIRK